MKILFSLTVSLVRFMNLDTLSSDDADTQDVILGAKRPSESEESLSVLGDGQETGLSASRAWLGKPMCFQSLSPYCLQV